MVDMTCRYSLETSFHENSNMKSLYYPRLQSVNYDSGARQETNWKKFGPVHLLFSRYKCRCSDRFVYCVLYHPIATVTGFLALIFNLFKSS